LDNPLCQARYVGKDGRMVAALPDRVRCMELLTKVLGWCEPTQISISVGPLQRLLNSIHPHPRNIVFGGHELFSWDFLMRGRKLELRRARPPRNDV
jgi:hypothetical protein